MIEFNILATHYFRNILLTTVMSYKIVHKYWDIYIRNEKFRHVKCNTNITYRVASVLTKKLSACKETHTYVLKCSPANTINEFFYHWNNMHNI